MSALGTTIISIGIRATWNLKGNRLSINCDWTSLAVIVLRAEWSSTGIDHQWPSLIFAPGEPEKIACQSTVFEPHWLSLFSRRVNLKTAPVDRSNSIALLQPPNCRKRPLIIYLTCKMRWFFLNQPSIWIGHGRFCFKLTKELAKEALQVTVPDTVITLKRREHYSLCIRLFGDVPPIVTHVYIWLFPGRGWVHFEWSMKGSQGGTKE